MTSLEEVIDISDKIHDLIYKDRIMVRNPHTIEARILEGFFRNPNQAHVTLVKGEESAIASLVRINHNSVVVLPVNNNFTAERGQHILVLFSHNAYNTTYVLQTEVEKKIFAEYWLRYLDPRFEKRYVFQLNNTVSYHLLPPLFYGLIKNREVRIVRHTLTQREKGEEQWFISDNMYQLPGGDDVQHSHPKVIADNVHPEYKKVLKTIPKEGSLKDVSLGGICLLVEEEPYDDKGLVSLELELPSLPSESPASRHCHISLRVLGAIRGVSKKKHTYGLHIGFLKRLTSLPLEGEFHKHEQHSIYHQQHKAKEIIPRPSIGSVDSGELHEHP